FWLADGLIERRGDHLLLVEALELPDIWATRVEARLLAALDELELDDLDEDMLLDWLTCAAVEGQVFTEAGLFGATDDVTPEQGAALLGYLAESDLPIIVPAGEDTALKTPCWRFHPAGLSELLLQDADTEGVAYYALKLFDALEAAAHP